MSVANCARCNQLFRQVIKNICPSCIKEEEKSFEKVRYYVRRNRNCDIPTVSRETGVSTDLIIYFLQEGRLELSGHHKIGYPCRDCGELIYSGAYCMDCQSEKDEIQTILRSLATDKPTERIETESKRKNNRLYAKFGDNQKTKS